jgi:hypothetical protein
MKGYILATFNQNTVGLIVLNVLGSGTNSLVDLVELLSKLAGNKVRETLRSPFISDKMLRLRKKKKVTPERYVNYEGPFLPNADQYEKCTNLKRSAPIDGSSATKSTTSIDIH